ncbi:MAG: TIGR03000 domain-containing protein [Planctomycetia bacterium]|nr:TIGR03000 domain-containing protein [Planctomycetia bacterium]
MSRTSIRAFAVLAVVGFAFAAQQAEAGWHHHHNRGWYGYGSCGSSGGWGYGSWGSSGGSWGSSGGWAYGSWGSSGGWAYGSWGSSGGSWGSSGGSSGGHHVMPSTPAQPAPATPPAAPTTPPGPSDAAPAAGPAPTNSTYHPTYGPMRNSALLSVKVPADAKVFVNDHETSSTGTDREYISRDLQNGARYNYEVRAEFTRDGQSVSETRSIQLTAGQTASVDFTPSIPSVQTAAIGPVQTTLVVHVPADAKLFLAGHETKATGEVREFTTTRLASGSEWTTYAIRAEIERDGKTQVREENVTLKAGESRDVSLAFDAPASGDRVANAAAR